MATLNYYDQIAVKSKFTAAKSKKKKETKKRFVIKPKELLNSLMCVCVCVCGGGGGASNDPKCALNVLSQEGKVFLSHRLITKKAFSIHGLTA